MLAVAGLIEAAASNLAGIGSTINEAHTAAAASTTSIASAAGDEVSAAIAKVFGSYAQAYQSVAGRAAAFHDLFTGGLHSAANSYAATEAANATSVGANTLAAGRSIWDAEDALFKLRWNSFRHQALLTEQQAMTVITAAEAKLIKQAGRWSQYVALPRDDSRFLYMGEGFEKFIQRRLAGLPVNVPGF